MTKDQLNDLAIKVADSIFARLVAKQEEWDKQFNEWQTNEETFLIESDLVHEERILIMEHESLIASLHINLAKELYSNCHIIQKKIAEVEEKLSKFK